MKTAKAQKECTERTAGTGPEKKTHFAAIRGYVARIGQRMDINPLLSAAGTALTVWAVVEILNQRSLDKMFVRLFTNPLVCFYNFCLILITLCVPLFFKRRKYLTALISALWLLLALTNFILLFMRTTPLTAVDFTLIFSVLPIVRRYLTIWHLVLIAVFLLAVIAAFVFFGIKARKTPVAYGRSTVFAACVAAVCVGTTLLFTRTGILGTNFSNLADAYKQYGFAYCFGTSLFDRGVDRPADYSDDLVIKIGDDLGDGAYDAAVYDQGKAPNIIMVQLESFFDVTYLKGLTYSEDPLPNFRYLKENNSSGFLTVPSIGAGTANTEFEVLTGMSLDYFGTGEYPYKTILQETTCESICYNLKEYGYSCHALHNNDGSFYNRNLVFPNLGFDTFTSIEYMDDVTYNVQGWAEDQVLTGEIEKILDSTEGRDFVFGITVQAHGKYSAGLVADGQHIQVNGIENEDERSAFEYYVGQMHETDRFIGRLINQLQQRKEKTILVLYGDHLPSFELEDEDLTEGNALTTEYVIWSNYGLAQEECDLEAYQLSAHVLGMAGYDAGYLTKLHQGYSEDEGYQSMLEMLEYDMLYGDHAVYDGAIGYEPTQLQMGCQPVGLERAEYKNRQFYLYGSGFTPYSQVYVNEEEQDTVFVDSQTLIVRMEEPEEDALFVVSQVSSDYVVLSSTEPVKYQSGG